MTLSYLSAKGLQVSFRILKKERKSIFFFASGSYGPTSSEPVNSNNIYYVWITTCSLTEDRFVGAPVLPTRSLFRRQQTVASEASGQQMIHGLVLCPLTG